MPRQKEIKTRHSALVFPHGSQVGKKYWIDIKIMSTVDVNWPSTIVQNQLSTSDWCQLLVSNWCRTWTSKTTKINQNVFLTKLLFHQIFCQVSFSRHIFDMLTIVLMPIWYLQFDISTVSKLDLLMLYHDTDQILMSIWG